jgi:hypothetical protein
MPSMPGVGTHPDLPTTLVHFTGRPRAASDVPPDFADATAEERMVRILIEGELRATTVFGADRPVICFSEPSEAARRVMLRNGVTKRGPYAPWGLIFDRGELIAAGARPVLYLSSEEWADTDDLPHRLRNRRVRYDPGRADWLHEREWRLCFGRRDTPRLKLTPELVAGVIVGQVGWEPPPTITHSERTWTPSTRRGGPRLKGRGRVWSTHVRYSAAADQLPRWWWNGEDLIEDGVFDIRTQMRQAEMHRGQ